MSGEPEADIEAPAAQHRPDGAGRRSSDADVSRRSFRVGALVVIAVAAGLVAWLTLRHDGGSSSAPRNSTATAMTPAALARLARSLRHPIFWLGRKHGVTYEVTQTGNGTVYVRYLPVGVEVGSPKPYLTVATYPFPGAYAALRAPARGKAAVTARVAHRGLALLDDGYPESVHVAYPGVDYQVEVYDPTPARAMQLVAAGRLRNLGPLTAGSPAATGTLGLKPRAATIADLSSFAAQLGHPLYWIGPKPGYTYELSTNSSGSVFIRYLPPGATVGDPRARYVIVATYPFRGAFAAVAGTAKHRPTIALAHGGIAVIDTGYPNSIHLAFPNSPYQIEVYDPSPSAGRQLVASGAVAQVP
jgi:hypothetical protein